jgi:hypothetical protein
MATKPTRANRPVAPKNQKRTAQETITAASPAKTTPISTDAPLNGVVSPLADTQPVAEHKNGVLHTEADSAVIGQDDTSTEHGETQPPQKVRVQTNKTIGISISAARVRRHIDKLNLNEKIDTMIGEIKEKTNAFKVATEQLESRKTKKKITKTVDDKEVTEEVLVDLTPEEITRAQTVVDQYGPLISDLDARANALSRERTRFSNEAPIVLAIICDELIQQLIDFSMKQVLLMRKKIVQKSHLHRPDIESLTLYPLIKSLPGFIKTAEKLSDEEKIAHDAETLRLILKQAEKDFKKKYAEFMPKKKKGAAPADAATHAANAPDPLVPLPPIHDPLPEDDDDALDDDASAGDSKTSFKYYVHQICKEIMKSDLKYSAIRTSPVFREYLSDLLVEFIQRICPLILLTAGSMKNKTINDVAILSTIESILIDGHKHVESVELKIEQVPDAEAIKALLEKKEKAKEAAKDLPDKEKEEAIKIANESYLAALVAVPKVDGWVAHRKISYPSSGYAALQAKVHQKMVLYKALSKKDKALAAGSVDKALDS